MNVTDCSAGQVAALPSVCLVALHTPQLAKLSPIC